MIGPDHKPRPPGRANQAPDRHAHHYPTATPNRSTVNALVCDEHREPITATHPAGPRH